MIVFIDLQNQITETYKQFAFFNTVPDLFIEINGRHTWPTVEMFVEDYKLSPSEYPLERFISLISDEWINTSNQQQELNDSLE